jgi:hypothetical protein
MRPQPRLIILLLTAGLAAGSVLLAQEGLPADEEPTGPKITIHGYLSQAYARTDGGEILGIPAEGTADYRTAALQIRADVTEQDTFAVQLHHERFGTSDLQALHDDLALDWIFYEHRIGQSSIRVGRVPIPFGIYNEVQDVGTLLPFYRPSANFYGDGAYTSEGIDGFVVSHAFDLRGGWRLDGDLHYGNWEFINRAGGFELYKVRSSLGVELWLETPLPGLRIGTGGMRYDVEEPDGFRWETWHVSLEGELGRVMTHVEYKLIDFGQGTYDGGYAHLGIQATGKAAIHAQYDYSNLDIDFFRTGDFDDDMALGLSYAFRPDLVLKLEHHWNEGYTPEEPVQNFFAPKVETRYGIVSLSTSF